MKKRELSECHREATEVTITLPAITKDICEHLSQQHSKEKTTNRQMLLKKLSCIKTYECETCRKTFKTASNLQRHRRTHTLAKSPTSADTKAVERHLAKVII